MVGFPRLSKKLAQPCSQESSPPVHKQKLEGPRFEMQLTPLRVKSLWCETNVHSLSFLHQNDIILVGRRMTDNCPWAIMYCTVHRIMSAFLCSGFFSFFIFLSQCK